MKTTPETYTSLINEIETHKDIQNGSLTFASLNEKLGYSSLYFSTLLSQLLTENQIAWIDDKWIDDSLIESAETNLNIFTMKGVVIWGVYSSTKQWVDIFEINIDFESKASTINFVHSQNLAVPYENYNPAQYNFKNLDLGWKIRLGYDLFLF